MWKWQLVLSALATFTTAFAAPMPSVTIDVQKVDETIEPVPRIARFDYEAGESDSSNNSSARPAAIEHMSSAADPVRFTASKMLRPLNVASASTVTQWCEWLEKAD